MLIEAIVAVGILGTVLSTSVQVLATGNRAIGTVQALTTAQGFARSQLEYTKSDSYCAPPCVYATIDLPSHLFTLLQNEAREFAFDLYQDGAPDKVRQLAHRSRVRTQRTRDRLKMNRETDNRLNYGRKARI